MRVPATAQLNCQILLPLNDLDPPASFRGIGVVGSDEETALTMAPEAKQSWIHRARSKPHVQGGNISVLGSHLVAASGEFVGTFFFLWLGYGGQLMALTQAAAPAGTGGGASSETVVFISLIYSFSLLVNAWAFYRISGGLFNPAVSFLSRGRTIEI